MGDTPEREKAAGGPAAVLSTLQHAAREMGVARSIQTLRLVNQARGFDCPGCAWPDPEQRSFAEFCENGAKAVAHEATRARIGAAFFAEWPVERLLAQSDHWLEQQGRLCEPLWRPAGSSHFQPITWEAAFARCAERLNALASPDQAVFYTSGRTSNEAAFLYQLFVRQLGTNNLPLANSLGNGNAPRNTERTASYWNTDLSIMKRFSIFGERQLIVRADAFNAFNQDQYGLPTVLMNSASFGQNGANWGRRIITLSAKFVW